MIEFTCLCCEGQHEREGKDHFPCNTKCDVYRDKHFDWCAKCRGLIIEGWRNQLGIAVKPKRKLRTEDDSA